METTQTGLSVDDVQIYQTQQTRLMDKIRRCEGGYNDDWHIANLLCGNRFPEAAQHNIPIESLWAPFAAGLIDKVMGKGFAQDGHFQSALDIAEKYPQKFTTEQRDFLIKKTYFNKKITERLMRVWPEYKTLQNKLGVFVHTLFDTEKHPWAINSYPESVICDIDAYRQ